jgi:hypothetical protein
MIRKRTMKHVSISELSSFYLSIRINPLKHDINTTFKPQFLTYIKHPALSFKYQPSMKKAGVAVKL